MTDKKINTKVLIKAAVIGVLLLLMLIPLHFVKGIMAERQNYKDQALNTISSAWGGNQLIAAPFVEVPYTYTTEVKEQGVVKKITNTSYRRFSPKDLDINIELLPQVRYIGIFDVPVYTAQVQLKGNFEGKYPPANYIYEAARLIMEIEDIKGIAKMPEGVLNGEKLDFAPHLGSVIGYSGKLGASYNHAATNRGFSGPKYDSYEYGLRDSSSSAGSLKVIAAPFDFNPEKTAFDINIVLRGSGSFNIVPLGKENKITASSSWKDPFFFGNFLPDEKEVTSKGFTARWDISYLAGGIPQSFGKLDVTGALFGVNLSDPVDNYRNGLRAVKHAILFLALTFLSCFVFEIAAKSPVHPFQYVLVGLSMAVFYLLLISLSDFISFTLAYLISAAVTSVMIGLYTKYAVIRKEGLKSLFISAGMIAVLYAYLYILLQLQDFSLLFGAFGLLTGLGIVMYTTKNINWYE